MVLNSDLIYDLEVYDDRESWLPGRHDGVGASDAAAIVGFGYQRGQYAVWCDKTEPVRPEEQDLMQLLGHLDEPTIATLFRLFALEDPQQPPTGSIVDPGDYTIAIRRDNPVHRCTPDRLIRRNGQLAAVLELKTAYHAQAKIWLREVPVQYMIQMQWQMHVLGLNEAYIAVRCNGHQFAWHPVRRSERFIAKLVNRVDQFWEQHVLARVAPQLDATAATAAWLAHLYCEPEPRVVELGHGFDAFGQRWDALTDAETRIKKAKDLIKNQVKAAMGNHELARLSDGSGFSWAGDTSRRFTRKQKVRFSDDDD